MDISTSLQEPRSPHVQQQLEGKRSPYFRRLGKTLTTLTLSEVGLLLANATPIFGILFLGWNGYTLMFLYFAETLIVGIISAVKMIVVGSRDSVKPVIKFLLSLAPFLVFLLLIVEINANLDTYDEASTFSLVVKVFWDGVVSTWFSLLAIALSHVFSFVFNFLGKQEYQRVTLDQLQVQPWRRVIIMWLSLIPAFMIFGWVPIPYVVPIALLLMKTLFDLAEHREQRVQSGTLSDAAL